MAVFPAGHILTSADFDTLFPTGVAAPATYTPVVVQSNTPTLSVEYAAYQKVGRWVNVLLSVNITSAGTANNAITCTFPAAAGAPSSYRCLGVGAVYDASASIWYSGQVSYASSTTFHIYPNAVPPLGATGSSMTAALANGDKVSASFQFYTAS